MPYKIEGDAVLENYTPDQLGTEIYNPRSTRSKDSYDLIVMDGTNQVSVLEGASWPICRTRTIEMLAAGIDLDDIRGIPLGETARGALRGGLSLATTFLWWAADDDIRANIGGESRSTYAQHLAKSLASK
jgi:hypothetical protein